MKQLKKFTRTVFILLFSLAFSLMFFSCETSDPISAGVSNSENPMTQKQLNFLKLKSTNNTLNKKRTVKKWVTRSKGGSLNLTYGNSSGSAGLIYGVSFADNKIYQIDPNNPSQPVEVGQLLFKTRAIAVHPQTGQVFYASAKGINGLYPFAIWDPATNTNTVLPSANATGVSSKLAFALDGTLYAVDRDNKKHLLSIDTQTGAWLSYQPFNESFAGMGDFAFSADGNFYNVNGYNSEIQVADFSNNTLANIGYTNLSDLSGMACGSNGMLYICRKNGGIYTVNTTTAQTTYLGNTGISKLEDLASDIFEVELAYANVSLDIPPNAVDADVEIEINLETTELVGGVAMTFSPHGTIFNTPAILNIEAHGVDFSGVNPNSVDIFYDNQETGVWEPMQRDQLIVDVNAGTVQVINAQLPHFSRYALAAD